MSRSTLSRQPPPSELRRRRYRPVTCYTHGGDPYAGIVRDVRAPLLERCEARQRGVGGLVLLGCVVFGLGVWLLGVVLAVVRGRAWR